MVISGFDFLVVIVVKLFSRVFLQVLIGLLCVLFHIHV